MNSSSQEVGTSGGHGQRYSWKSDGVGYFTSFILLQEQLRCWKRLPASCLHPGGESTHLLTSKETVFYSVEEGSSLIAAVTDYTSWSAGILYGKVYVPSARYRQYITQLRPQLHTTLPRAVFPQVCCRTAHQGHTLTWAQQGNPLGVNCLVPDPRSHCRNPKKSSAEV